ncbi:MAG: ABC-F family ATP-binding cassette domain-containing protein [Burkholderiaceae bacterium]
MIRLRSLTLARSGRVLMRDVDVQISPGERVALVGDNGSGKSTLLAALDGDLQPEAGHIDLPARWRVVRLMQSLPESDAPAWEFVLQADTALLQAQERLAQAQSKGDGMAMAQAHDDLLSLDGPSAPARARELLHGLGFSDEQSMAPVTHLSGGWKMRLNLARALMAPADLLLLDEPTNHLDLDAVLWLERRLARLPCTQILVSHDRDFLDRVAQATLHLEAETLTRYSGGYSACEQARAERAAQRERAVLAQQTRIAQLQGFVERFRAKATKARQAQSRLKALERMERLAPLRARRSVDFSFTPTGDCPDPLVRAESLDAGYDNQAIVQGASLTIGRGSRIGVLGRNGAGKTTLIRTLVGEQPALAGELYLSRSVRVGYFAQQQVDALIAESSPLQHMQRLAPSEREQVLRDWLGRFGFRGDDATRAVGPMSGGERARLALAMLIWGKPQLLVLDEPTNHLDGTTRDALAEAMAEFDGALLLVSHDRYMLRASVDQFVRVARGRLEAFEGDLEDYAQWLMQPDGGSAVPGATRSAGRLADASLDTADAPHSATGPESTLSRKEERREAAQARARLAVQRKPLEQQLNAVDQRLAQIAQRMQEIDRQLADPDAFRDPQNGATLARERSGLEGEHAALEDEWLHVSEALERLGV